MADTTASIPTVHAVAAAMSWRRCLCQIESKPTPISFDINWTYALSRLSHGQRKIFSLILAPKISGRPSFLTMGLKHSVSGFPLLGIPSTMKKCMLFSLPSEWKYSISLPTYSDLAELGEQMTIRFLDSRRRFFSSSSSPPG